VTSTIILPVDYLNIITQLLMDRRGEQVSMENLGKDRIILVYKLPMVFFN
jgi:translation elongation factor EF-4